METDPFVKMPLIYNTFLGAQSTVGLTTLGRMETYKGDVTINVYATYKIFMFVHEEFFRHLDNVLQLLNGFYSYCYNHVDTAIGQETAYALCTSLLPTITKPDLALHILLTATEIKTITNDVRRVEDISSIIFEPAPVPDLHVIL